MKRLKETLKGISEIDYALMEKAQNRLDNLTKPKASLGRLEELAKQVAAITRNQKPLIKNKVIFTLAADHGVADEGVSAYPKEVTAQMVYNFLRGGAGINVLARHIGAQVIVVDMGVGAQLEMRKSEAKNFKNMKIAYGTKNMAQGPAMTRRQAIKSIENGIRVFEEFGKKIDIAATGDMGIANTTASSAITAVITGRPVKEVTGRGTGIDSRALSHKIEVIKKALALNRPNPEDALDVLAKVGGFEIGGIAGIILAAAKRRVPVVIDGFISAAGALIAHRLEPRVKNYIIAGHCSVEKGHKIALEYLGLKPLLNLDLRLGEGTGAALAMGIVEASVKILTQMATFQSAAVSHGTDRKV